MCISSDPVGTVTCARAMPPCLLHLAHLRGGVALAQRGGAVLQCLVVNGDSKRHANLVRARVSEQQGQWARGQGGWATAGGASAVRLLLPAAMRVASPHMVLQGCALRLTACRWWCRLCQWCCSAARV